MGIARIISVELSKFYAACMVSEYMLDGLRSARESMTTCLEFPPLQK